MNTEKKKVVIVGASFAGLICAREFKDSDFDVLVLEKNGELGIKTCGCGVEDEDLDYIPEQMLSYPLSPLVIEANGQKKQMPEGRGLISSIDRPEVLMAWADELNLAPNIKIELNSKVATILPQKISLENGNECYYDFLVGADGSLSQVRKYLNLPMNKCMVAAEYIVPTTKYQEFVMAADQGLFDKGYAWIFPNKGFATIGAAVDISSQKRTELKKNLNQWIHKNKIAIDGGKFEGFVINYDYQGYKFGNIYLAGDAAGLADGLTGKGIYAGCLSGKRIAKEILGKDTDPNPIDNWLIEKNRNESILHESPRHFLELKLQLEK